MRLSNGNTNEDGDATLYGLGCGTWLYVVVAAAAVLLNVLGMLAVTEALRAGHHTSGEVLSFFDGDSYRTRSEIRELTRRTWFSTGRGESWFSGLLVLNLAFLSLTGWFVYHQCRKAIDKEVDRHKPS